jgi:hypothetical protein
VHSSGADLLAEPNREGASVISRVVAVAIALIGAGCANEPASSLGSEARGLSAATEPASQEADSDVAPLATKKSMASKVLSAIAFERVTGLKADPARLVTGD